MLQVKIHGLLLSAASPFLSNIFNTTFSPNLEHTVIRNPENMVQSSSSGLGVGQQREGKVYFLGFQVQYQADMRGIDGPVESF